MSICNDKRCMGVLEGLLLMAAGKSIVDGVDLLLLGVILLLGGLLMQVDLLLHLH